MGLLKSNINSIPAHAVPAAHGIDETRVPVDSVGNPAAKSQKTEKPNTMGKMKKTNFMSKIKSKFSTMMKNKKNEKKGNGNTTEGTSS